jgi:hypothetical protein
MLGTRNEVLHLVTSSPSPALHIMQSIERLGVPERKSQ